jgi:hypothetical protein
MEQTLTSQGPPRTLAERVGFLSRRFQARIAPIMVAFVAAVLAFERLPKNARRTLWAEDGPLFLADALRGDGDLFAVYAGYLHVIPRAAAWIVVNTLNVRSFALGINLSACLVTGLVAAIVYVCAEDVVPPRALRIWLALMTVILPLVGVEVLANLANLHSILMWGAFWVLLRHPRTLGGAAALTCFALFAALSEVQTVLLAPLALFALWRHRSLRQGLVVAGCMLGSAGQTWAALTHQRDGYPHLLGAPTVTQLLGLEVAMPLWILDTGRVRELLETYGWALVVLAALPVIVGVALSLGCGNVAQRSAAFAAIGVSLLIFCVSHMLNGAVIGGPNYSVSEDAPVLLRYAVVPSLLFMAVLAIGTAAAWQEGRRNLRLLGAGSIAALLLASITHFRSAENLRSGDDSWTRQMREARDTCQQVGSAEYLFRISPSPWVVSVPCSRIR